MRNQINLGRAYDTLLLVAHKHLKSLHFIAFKSLRYYGQSCIEFNLVKSRKGIVIVIVHIVSYQLHST